MSMTKEELMQPAFPSQLDEHGWPISSQTGFNKLEAAALQMGAAILSLPESWQCMFSKDKPEEKARVFDRELVAKAAVRLAKAVLEECQKELND